jgi:S-formylglutathione hydrolase FrmB
VRLDDDARVARLRSGAVFSPVLGADIEYLEYRRGSPDRTLLLLHGRGASMDALHEAVAVLDALGDAPTVVMPDAPWGSRASWYVDSAYTGARVETALIQDFVPALEHLSGVTDRQRRIVGGYSMGGAGALRLALAYPDLFGAGLVLSPAAYPTLPPADSNTRRFGAFGRGDRPFDDDVYRALNYPSLADHRNPALPQRFYVAAGQAEGTDAAVAIRDALTRNRVPVRLEVFAGDHDWDTWRPALAAGLTWLSAPDRGLS